MDDKFHVNLNKFTDDNVLRRVNTEVRLFGKYSTSPDFFNELFNDMIISGYVEKIGDNGELILTTRYGKIDVYTNIHLARDSKIQLKIHKNNFRTLVEVIKIDDKRPSDVISYDFEYNNLKNNNHKTSTIKVEGNVIYNEDRNTKNYIKEKPYISDVVAISSINTQDINKDVKSKIINVDNSKLIDNISSNYNKKEDLEIIERIITEIKESELPQNIISKLPNSLIDEIKRIINIREGFLLNFRIIGDNKINKINEIIEVEEVVNDESSSLQNEYKPHIFNRNLKSKSKKFTITPEGLIVKASVLRPDLLKLDFATIQLMKDKLYDKKDVNILITKIYSHSEEDISSNILNLSNLITLLNNAKTKTPVLAWYKSFLPISGENFLTSFYKFIRNNKKGHTDEYFNNKSFEKVFETNEGRNFTGKLLNEFEHIRKNIEEFFITKEYSWKHISLPLLVNDSVKTIDFYVYDSEKRNDNSDLEIKNSKFIIELNSNHFGNIQIEGLYIKNFLLNKKSNLNITFKTNKDIEKELRDNFTVFYKNVLENHNMTGNILFYTEEMFTLSPKEYINHKNNNFIV